MMRRKITAALAVCFLLFGRSAFAHRIDEYLQATILSLEGTRVHASMRLIPGILVSASVIAEIDSNGDGVFSDAEEHAYAERVLGDLYLTVDGQNVQPNLVSWSFPQPAQMRDGLGEIHIEYTADLPSGGSHRSLILANHHLNRTSVYLVNAEIPEDHNTHILAQRRNEQQTVYELDYELDYQPAGAGVDASRTLWNDVWMMLHGVQFSSLFHLGMHHIAEGTDHLLFLITLLLPAPLLLAGRRWGPPAGVRQSLLRILGIVTAFTVGHSITLTLAALGALHAPSRPIEVLIAVSIFVSALHALRPIVPGKEALIAGFFGLIHGLAFAATLDRLGLGRWERMTGIFAFNVGIEAMQMLVVAAILPSLMLMSRTRAYSFLRIGGALFAGTASLGWIAERIFGIETHVDTIVNVLARHAVWIAAGFFVLSVVNRLLTGLRAQQADPTDGATVLPIS
jgi:hypothetical protein